MIFNICLYIKFISPNTLKPIISKPNTTASKNSNYEFNNIIIHPGTKYAAKYEKSAIIQLSELTLISVDPSVPPGVGAKLESHYYFCRTVAPLPDAGKGIIIGNSQIKLVGSESEKGRNRAARTI